MFVSIEVNLYSKLVSDWFSSLCFKVNKMPFSFERSVVRFEAIAYRLKTTIKTAAAVVMVAMNGIYNLKRENEYEVIGTQSAERMKTSSCN